VEGEQVILVDEADRVIGSEEKLLAHRLGSLHRAVSVLVVDREGRWLLQQRAADKYHSGRLWSNACCGHPRPGETAVAAAARRLWEEMGIQCPLNLLSQVRYTADVCAGLTENEIAHVFLGRHEGDPVADPCEAMSWAWQDPAWIAEDMLQRPLKYTPWFRIYFDRLRHATQPPDGLTADLAPPRRP